METPEAFYSAINYEAVFDSSLVGKRCELPSDLDTGEKRCRFCGKMEPEADFRPEAHAIPALLGNRAVFSPNECGECNNRFGRTCEDHLGKAILFERAISGIRGRTRLPTNEEGNGLRIGWSGGRREILITDPKLFENVSGKDGEFTLTIPLGITSQPFAPIEATKALVKIACSLCPPNLVPKIERTIHWLMGRAVASFSSFPVFYTFTPGDNPYGDGRALLLKRTGRQPIPYLWCIVASTNHRFQYFVPFCNEDQHWLDSGRYEFKTFYYPTWLEETETDHHVWDWSSRQTTRRSFDAEITSLNSRLAGDEGEPRA